MFAMFELPVEMGGLRCGYLRPIHSYCRQLMGAGCAAPDASVNIA
jgi:hypothetical protein